VFNDNWRVKVGDHTEIHDSVKIVGDGNVVIGDYTKIHAGTLIIAQGTLNIGEACWIGQNCVIDSTGGLDMGNFVGVGIGSSLYSHIRHGDIAEGCMYNSEKKLTIGDDAWFVGQCLVNPVNVAPKSVAMLGSVIVKDMEYGCVYGGNPAQNISHKMQMPWMLSPIVTKYKVVSKLLEDGIARFGLAIDDHGYEVVMQMPENSDPNVTYYDVSTRTYTKTDYPGEVTLNKWLFSARAKFKKAV
jgi:acetyltransferase-like isoleucine patch superfamily enzyme